MQIRLGLMLLLVAIGSCASRPAPPAHEIFDEQTASTLTVVSKPLVFARERSDVEAHARDYATLVAVEIDMSGQFREFLLLYRWSTVDRRMSPPPQPSEGALRILADGRAIDLQPMAQLPVSMKQSRDLHVPAHGDVVPRAYRVDTELLRSIAASRELMLRMPQEQLNLPFALWEDGRGALANFVHSVNAP
ncbi:MAG TPA: hypothetical protein VGI65_01660 [Steroidobacteraceae bacterium]|jgi:hypothetical protein